ATVVGTINLTPTPTPGSVTAPPIVIRGCSQVSGSAHIFQTCPADGGQSELALESWAVQQDLQLKQLPASDATRVMTFDRDAVRGLIFSRLEAAATRTASQQTPEEQSLLGAASSSIQAFKIAAAQAAQTEYTRWQQNPFCYQPPQAALAAGGW